MEELKTILIQTGYNIERMFQDKAITEPAHRVLKLRNEMAIEALDRIENVERGDSKSRVG